MSWVWRIWPVAIVCTHSSHERGGAKSPFSRAGADPQASLRAAPVFPPIFLPIFVPIFASQLFACIASQLFACQLFACEQKLTPESQVTRDHIERSSFTRLKTKFSTQITSGSMQKCLEAYPNRPSTQLVEFCRQFDRYIDLMNSGTPRRSWTGTKAGLRYPIRGTDDARVAELIGIVQWFDDWFDANEALPASTKTLRQMRFITDELYYDLRLAIRGFVGFVAHATGQYSSGPDVAIIPRLFNQDCVEGHFSLLRGSSGARTAITALELPQAQSAALVQNRMGGMERGNVTEHGGGAEGRILQPELKSREQARKEEQKRKNEGRALAQKYGIALY